MCQKVEISNYLSKSPMAIVCLVFTADDSKALTPGTLSEDLKRFSQENW